MAKIETPQPIRGTQSLLGEEADRFHEVVAAFDRVRRLYGFKRVEVPLIEPTAVFARTIGETTDVVSKEMYSFEDRSGDSITLRPEFTAGICRAYLSEGWQQFAPLKVATHGAAFRYERPQKGRYRQFHQLDAEIIGAAEPQADVEILALGSQLLAELGIKAVTLKLNSLGDAESRNAWRSALIDHFAAHRADLSDDSRDRLEKNPLRILDSKDPRDRPFVDTAPEMKLTAPAEEFFGKVRDGLKAAGVGYELDPMLVRGLDYYRHTAFEFVTDQLGAQGAVIAGGRYDGLIESLGGPHTPAIGWAAGIERLAMLIGQPAPEAIDAAIVVEDDAAMDAALAAASRLRSAGLAVELIATGSPRKRFDRAVKKGAKEIVVLGFAEGAVTRRVKSNDEPRVEALLA
ncbi:histidine--tRNA ligase [Sphingomonas sp. RB56-2]|uniref:Histidine--tRNA ligase n=1 Tax=Sphingomonas brevis TaxID=2908206 RepID=A0ABT0SB86_9SPHN|nr:histidine--tRNA ligase [Sphingomonas brevis]MCL6741679.1 histidine--tRNA ligase [Sphingomonas brevis]